MGSGGSIKTEFVVNTEPCYIYCLNPETVVDMPALMEEKVVVTWDMVRGAILVCMRDDGVKAKLIKSALAYVDKLEKREEAVPFTDVYALPDGQLVLEWSIENDVFYRITVEDAGKGTLRITRPDSDDEVHSMSW